MVWLQSLRVLALILLWAPWRSHGLITTKSPHALVHMDSFKRPPFSRLVRRPAAKGSAGGDDAEIEGEPPSSVEESAAPSAWPWAESAAGLAAGLASEVGRRLGEANALEVRLDLTILWCHVLARGLVGEILTRPLKQVPGITPDDLAILLSVRQPTKLLSAPRHCSCMHLQCSGNSNRVRGHWHQYVAATSLPPECLSSWWRSPGGGLVEGLVSCACALIPPTATISCCQIAPHT